VNREPDDAMREGVEIWVRGAADHPMSRLLSDEFDRLNAADQIANGRRWSRAFGGGAVVIVANDGAEKMADPLDELNLQRIHALVDVDRHELKAYSLANLVTGAIGEPEHYLWTRNGRSVVVHRSRLILFNGVPLPYRVRRQNNWWGGSVLDLVWQELKNYSAGHEDAAAAIGKLIQDVFLTKRLARAIDAGDLDAVRDRLEALAMGLGIRNAITIDPDEEEYRAVPRPMTGVGEILEALVAALVAATDMPRSILLGETPGGLNAGENAGEIRSWYDHVRVVQTKVYTPALARVLRLVMLQHEGPTRGQLVDAKVCFPSLWQETDAEKAATRKTNAEARKTDLDALLITAEEARTDPDLDGRYTLSEEPPAVPPEEEMAAEPEDAFAEMPTDLISAASAATRLGVTPAVLHGLRRRGKLTGWYVGSQWRYSAGEIAGLVTKQASLAPLA
jgi:phage-related protein (TIGR01555 family)